MSKKQKSRKYRRPNLPKNVMPVDRGGGETGPVAAASIGPRAARVEAFNPDYTHVKRDLRRIGILAGSFIAIMVVLSFFL